MADFSPAALIFFVARTTLFAAPFTIFAAASIVAELAFNGSAVFFLAEDVFATLLIGTLSGFVALEIFFAADELSLTGPAVDLEDFFLFSDFIISRNLKENPVAIGWKLRPEGCVAQMIFQYLPNAGGKRLIRHRESSVMKAPSIEIANRNSPPLIFVVDDNPDLTQMAEIVLSAEGYQCQLFCDPKQVLRAFEESPVRPDLLLTDYEMGSMNGLELVEHCRRDMPDLKAILLSGTVEAATVLRHPVKVNEFLSKPYQPKQLVALVQSLLADESSAI